MKKLLLIITLCVNAALVNAQTKEETVKWLTEKMMRPCFMEQSRISTAKIIFVKFDDNYIYCTTSEIYVSGNTHSTQYKVDLTKLNLDESAWIGTEGKYVETLNEKGELKSAESLLFKIDGDCEPNIIQRFKKALNHYRSLMTIKKPNKETF